MSHEPLSNADFWRTVASGNRKIESATFNATSRCGKVLQIFESDSKICNIIAWIYEKVNRAVLQMFAYCFGNMMSCETWITNKRQNSARIFKVQAFATNTVHGKIGSSTMFDFKYHAIGNSVLSTANIINILIRENGYFSTIYLKQIKQKSRTIA